jgi:hypothetical protein
VATEVQLLLGAVVCFQVSPEFVDVYIQPESFEAEPPTATTLAPSAEAASEYQTSLGAPPAVQLAPESADM